MKRALVPASLLVLVALVAACGDDDPAVGGGGQGGEGAVGAGGAPPTEGQVTKVSAPTRTSIEIVVTGDTSTVPTDASAFEITGDFGGVAITAVSFDDAAQKIVLTTEKQKLGVEYTLRIVSPGSQFDQEGGSFPSADTVTLWATDLASFQDYEVTAERLAIGERIVIYATPDVSPDDVDETVQKFDEEVFPIETALFHPAPDRDENGKIVILGLDGEGQYAGYFSPLNSVTAEQAESWGYHSNEMEMLYISVPDLMGSLDAEHTIPHEFSHLLYNEVHDFFGEDWAWHNEGLAECAVHAVNGVNVYGEYYYVNYPELQQGLSLVRWNYGEYAQYVQSYAFLTYAASRLGGVAGYGELFDLSGSPADLGAFFQAELGKTFAEVHLDMLTAAWAQAPTGVYGFSGMITFPNKPLALDFASAPQQLSAFEGLFFSPGAGAVTPAGAGPSVRFAGIDAQGNVDLVEPYEATGGAIVALNTNQNAGDPATESSGALPAAAAALATPVASLPERAWMHPPPFKPANMRLLRAWRKKTMGI